METGYAIRAALPSSRWRARACWALVPMAAGRTALRASRRARLGLTFRSKGTLAARAAVPGGVGGGDAHADFVRRQRLVPIVHPLVPHQHEIGQHRIRHFQEAASQLLAGPFRQRVAPQVEDDELQSQ